jgi:hypothetical protein
MADTEKLKVILRTGVARAGKAATTAQIDEVAKRLERERPLTESEVQEKLQRFGKDVIGDAQVFSAIDIDDIITVISQEERPSQEDASK